MEKNKLKNFIKNNKEKLPLSYINAIFRDNITNTSGNKNDYSRESITKQFYKPISRL